MKTLLRLEELLLAALSFALFLPLGYGWGWYFALLLAPDLTMLGYLGGPKLGALTYNLGHHRGIAVALYLVGLALAQPALQFAGLLLLGHASLDRVFGYGLKFPDSFHNTHLGQIGPGR